LFKIGGLKGYIWHFGLLRVWNADLWYFGISEARNADLWRQ